MKKPTHLNKKAYWKYEELEKIVDGQLKEGDENLLAVLANTYITYRDANDSLTEDGVILGGKTMKRQNPAWNIVKDAEKIIESISAHFGLSPKTRGDNMNGPDNKKDKLDELLDD
jgi:P27 family predicted phage terminase small subunit